ncbi:chitinase-3-like protein 1 [Pollicipes pollicipes]|uniref:chitinase-3-like protein 1 n=1 Tax=Pollicipes pollicipes TaxID=41117 RepID=UPI0018858A35|nr:chitinase-3-like protein 1 [Pollicipes pollicipes]
MKALTLVLLCWCAAVSAAQDTPNRLVCYYTSWGRYRTSIAKFTPENIIPHLCTHLHYAVVNTNDEQELGPADKFSDIDQQGYEHMVALKAANPALKLLMMLGGSKVLQQNAFVELASDEAKTKRFVKEAIKYIRRHRFDGIDIDWKAEGKKEQHAKLMEALAAGFMEEAKESGMDRLLLTTTIPASFIKIQNDFDIGRVSKAVDYMTALLYTFHGGSENQTAHHAALHATDPNTTNYADFVIQMLKEAGADPARLVMAVPTFGISFTLVDAERRGFGAPAKDAGYAGKYTKLAGTLSFTEICEHISMDGWQAFRPRPDAVGPYAVKGDQWVAYDDEVMMRRKGVYIREQGLGGAAVWTLAQDDFRGVCTGQPYPLIEALKEGLFSGVMVPPTTPSPPPTPVYDNTPVFTCPADGKFAKMDNCTEFYVCRKGLLEVLPCGDDQKYDAQLGVCDEDAPCVQQPLVGVTAFAPTPSPSTSRPLRPMGQTAAGAQMPPTAKPNVATFPAPFAGLRTTRPPAAPSTPLDSVVVLSASTPPPAIETMVDKDITDAEELRQLLALVQQLGGVRSVRRLLAAVDGPKRGAAQPAAQTTVTEVGGDQRAKVHVIVEVRSF